MKKCAPSFPKLGALAYKVKFDSKHFSIFIFSSSFWLSVRNFFYCGTSLFYCGTSLFTVVLHFLLLYFTFYCCTSLLTVVLHFFTIGLHFKKLKKNIGLHRRKCTKIKTIDFARFHQQNQHLPSSTSSAPSSELVSQEESFLWSATSTNLSQRELTTVKRNLELDFIQY